MKELGKRPIRKFNPGTHQSYEEVKEQFVVRKHEFEIVMEVLRGNIDSSSCQHVLVVGSRGWGKTMLLARVVAELCTDDDLSSHLLSVRFMEESQEIFCLADFWLETLFYLSRDVATHDPEFASELRDTHVALSDRWQEQALEEYARAAVLEAATRLRKKLVLMVENFESLCENVDDDFGWKLRGALQSEPQIMLLATSTSRSEGLDDATQPFFELFRSVVLQRLNIDECRRLWQVVSGDTGKGRDIRPLEILTGGNPRLMIIVAGFARHRSLRQLMEELVKLIDDDTEYFRSHLEIFGKTERRVYISVIDLWRASSAGEIAARARMDVRKVSTMLGRLVDRGEVTVEGSGKRRLYAAAERLYSIYYKLRRERDEAAVIVNLINFMVAFYEVGELFQMSDLLTSEASESTVIREGIKRALVERSSVDDVYSNMEWSAIKKISDQAAASHHFMVELHLQEAINAAFRAKTFEKVIEITDKAFRSPTAGISGGLKSRDAWLLHRRAMASHELNDFQAAIAIYQEVIEHFRESDAPEFQIEAARALSNKGVAQARLGDFAAAIATWDLVVERFGEHEVLKLQVAVAGALGNKGIALGQLGDFVAAITAFGEIIERFGESEAPELRAVLTKALFDKGIAQEQVGDFGAALATWNEVVKRFSESEIPEHQLSVARALNNKEFALGQLGDHAAAIATSDEVVKRFSESEVPELQVAVARALGNKGVAQSQRGDFEAAIAAWDEVSERFGESDVPEIQAEVAKGLVDKAVTRRQLGDFEASIAVCDEVIERFSESEMSELKVEVARALANLGVTRRRLGDLEAAIAAWDEVSERFDESDVPALKVEVARALANKGVTRRLLGDFEAAIAAWDEVSERFGESDVPEIQAEVAKALGNRGIAQGQLGDLVAAISTCNELIERFGESEAPELQAEVARALGNKGVAHRQLGDFEAAIAAWDEVSERFGESEALELQVVVARALGDKGIAQSRLGDLPTAIATCDEAVERFGKSEAPKLQEEVARVLGKKGIVQDQFGDFAAAIATYDEVIERFGESTTLGIQVEVATALSHKGMGQIKIGRAEEALQTCKELERRLGVLTGNEAIELAWSTTEVRIKALLLQGRHQAAMDEFRSAYAEFDPSTETMIQMMIDVMLRLVPDLLAVGCSEHDLLEILSRDKTKSGMLLPLVVALRQRSGEVVREAAEILEIASDIRKKIEQKRRNAPDVNSVTQPSRKT